MMRFIKIATGIIVLVLAIFFLVFYRGNIENLLLSFKRQIGDFSLEEKKNRILELEVENEELSEKVNRLLKDQELDKEDRYHYKVAAVYSRYPFNDMSMIIIDRGADDGIRQNMPVFTQKGILLGKVRSVSRTQSEIETIWNSSWRMSVSVGHKDIKAVYVGGSTPSLDLVPKEAELHIGDRIVSLSPDFPLNTLLGEVKEISNSTYEVWQKATVRPYSDFQSFSTVLVLIDFP